ncbi:MAG: hypothetical protein IJ105_05010 [Bacilli bacterium]|nr:hypothetical protein [Bacilli bacterium]
MKNIKRLLIVILMVLFVLPTTIFAEEKTYNTLNLDEALTEEAIDHDFSNYKENDDQITIYMFRGKGCGYCKKFLTFMNSIVDDYGKYFKVETYEVWNDADNAELMQNVASFMNEKAEGVPFVIIGDKVFNGYTESYDEDIKASIKELYETKKEDRYDVMKEYNDGTNTKEKDYDSTFAFLAVFSVIISAVSAIIVYFVNKNKISILEERIEVLEKGKKKNEK